MITLLLKLFVKDYRNTSNLIVRKRYGLFASFFGLFTNLILFVGKIFIGVFLGLYSIVTDAMNNLSDFGNNFISIVGVKVSAKKPDKEHPYGHQRAEYILSLIIGCIVIGLSMVMFYQGCRDTFAFFATLIDTGKPPVGEFSYPLYVVTLVILSVAIAGKLLQAYVYFSLGKRIDSMPLKALGKDARNDIITTTFVIIGVILTWFTSYDFDCFFTLVVAIFVFLSGAGIMKEAASALIGQQPSKELIEGIVNIVKSHEDVLGMHDLMLHYYGNLVYGVLHVEVDDRVDINDSHDVIDTIENEALDQLNVNLTIHMDPVKVNDPETKMLKAVILESLQQHSDVKIKMHDLHTFYKDDLCHIHFELVVPEDNDNEVEETRIKEYLIESIRKAFKKNFVLDIGFDNKVMDLLDGVYQEEK